jgi:hypothetical protein
MVAKAIATLKTDMPIGIVNAVDVQDIHNIIDTLEVRTSKTVLQKTGNYPAVEADDMAKIEFDSASPVTLTIPNTIPAGWECVIIQRGAGAVTVSVAGSPPLSRAGHTKTAGQYAIAYIIVTANSGTAPVVYLGGDTAA